MRSRSREGRPVGQFTRNPPCARLFGRGFTLIELLVVVAIIAVLVSILLPAMAGARKQAKQVLCNTNLRTMGQAAYEYAHENRDTIVRGEAREVEYGQDLHFVSCLLKGLAYDGRVQGAWRSGGSQFPFRDMCRKIKPLQCPTFPVAEQALDYVVSAFVIPYTRRNRDSDDQGGGYTEGDDGQWSGENTNALDISEYFQLTKFKYGSPATTTYIAEAHRSLSTTNFDYHDFFLTSQIPFGGHPRVANDKRHPGGTNVLFFDGHSETMPFRRFDPGWPRSLGERLRYFSVVPPELE